jgi:hypothetical protein
MSNGRNKKIRQANWQLVQKALNEHWDPIGVADQVDDEYDNYVGTICRMLTDRRVSQRAIRDYLYTNATVNMGLTSNPHVVKGCEKAAAVLVGLRHQFETQ